MTLALVPLVIGFTAVIAQIVLLRELLVVFSGSEISLGIALACWLAWSAAGSALAGRLASRLGDPRRAVAALLALAAAAFPLSVAAVRAARWALEPLPGEVLGPAAMFLTCATALSFVCLLSGGLFAAAGRLRSVERGVPTAEAAGMVYLMEAAGAGLGGLLASLVLLARLNASQIALLLSFLNLFAATLAARRARWLPVVALLVFAPLSGWLERASLARLWRGFDLVESRNSVYGNLAVIRTRDTTTVYENGLVSFTVPDPAAAEEAVHYALLEHRRPARLLLIGGGLNGSVLQALQHPGLRQVEYVELDPAVFALAARRLPREWAALGADPRVRVHSRDGRLFLKTAPPGFDVVAVNLGDPQTVQLNRFYTVEFFREAAARLAPGGLLALSLTGSENYIGEAQADLLRCIRRSLGEVFPEVVALPGSTIHLFAATRPGVLTGDPRELVARLVSRGLRTQYVREYFIPFRLTPDRMADLEAQARPRIDTPLNRDLAPIACYLDAAVWSSRFSRLDRGLPYLAGAALLLFLVSLVVAGRRAGASVAAMGFTQIGLEMMLLVGFQAVHGYVYHQLAVVIAGAMAGMALGSRLALGGAGFSLRTLVWLQVAAAAAGPAVCALLTAAPLLYAGIALLCGALGGYQFVVASRLSGAAGPGSLYALDLGGACLGALLFSAWLIPVFGFWKSSAVLAAVSLAPVLTQKR